MQIFFWCRVREKKVQTEFLHVLSSLLGFVADSRSIVDRRIKLFSTGSGSDQIFAISDLTGNFQVEWVKRTMRVNFRNGFCSFSQKLLVNEKLCLWSGNTFLSLSKFFFASFYALKHFLISWFKSLKRQKKIIGSKIELIVLSNSDTFIIML
jgi:hypothetical protein